MDPTLAENLIASLNAIADSVRLTHLYLMLLTAMIVPIWLDVVFRVGWICWIDLRRRREDRARRRHPTIERRHQRSSR